MFDSRASAMETEDCDRVLGGAADLANPALSRLNGQSTQRTYVRVPPSAAGM